MPIHSLARSSCPCQTLSSKSSYKTHTLLDINGENCTLQTRKGRRSFRSTAVKPYYADPEPSGATADPEPSDGAAADPELAGGAAADPELSGGTATDLEPTAYNGRLTRSGRLS